MSPLSDRPTADVVLIIITLMICAAILLTGAGIFIVALYYPEYDLSAAYSSFGNVIGLLVGAILGYLAGKGRSPWSKEQ